MIMLKSFQEELKSWQGLLLDFRDGLNFPLKNYDTDKEAFEIFKALFLWNSKHFRSRSVHKLLFEF